MATEVSLSISIQIHTLKCNDTVRFLPVYLDCMNTICVSDKVIIGIEKASILAKIFTKLVQKSIFPPDFLGIERLSL